MPRTPRRLLVALLLAPLAALAVERGAPAPDFTLPGPAGKVQLADYRGKVLYLDVWASWCVPCRQSFPWMNAMLAKYEAQGLRVVAVNVDRKPADAQRFLAQVPARFQLAFDAEGALPRSYGVKAMPSSFLIAADGRVLEVHSGFADDEKAQLEQRIRAALGLP